MKNISADLYKGTGVVNFSYVSRKQRLKDTPQESISSRADYILVAVAVLGLAASVADGEADYREIKKFTSAFQQEFLLLKSDAVKIIEIALKQMRTYPRENIIDCPCETLNEHLNLSQKMRLFDGLAEILIADGVIHKNEEHFLDYIAMKLNIVEALKEKFPVDKEEALN